MGSIITLIVYVAMWLTLIYRADLAYIGQTTYLMLLLLIYINYWYLMRLKRVQVQLNAKKEATNKIIDEINQSVVI